MQGLADPDQRFVDEVVTIAAMHSTSPESTQRTLRFMALAAFASMASMRVCDPMLPALSQEFNVSTGDASAVIAAFAVAYGVLQLFYGPLGDRLGKTRVVLGATSACAFFSAITALAPNLTALVVSRAAMGASAAGIIPLCMAWIGDQVPYEQRQETLAGLMVATVSGMMAGQWFGGFAVEALGWRVAFGVLAFLFATAATLLWRQVNASTPGARSANQSSAPFSLAAYLANTRQLLAMPRVRWAPIRTAATASTSSAATTTPGVRPCCAWRAPRMRIRGLEESLSPEDPVSGCGGEEEAEECVTRQYLATAEQGQQLCAIARWVAPARAVAQIPQGFYAATKHAVCYMPILE